MLSECVDGCGFARSLVPLGGGGLRRRQLSAVCGGSLFLLLLLRNFGFFLVECLTYDFGFA